MGEPLTNPAILPIGGRFQGRYEVVRCIKAGGMGAVYEVIHLETRRRRALKVMLPHVVESPEMRARFKLEATVAAEIESEHIVETFDAGVDEASGAPFLVMELLRGRDLSGALEERGLLPIYEVVTLLSQAALALDKTHAAGIVHRDLKPENLFLTARDDGSPRLKILDFGIAKVVAQSGRSTKQTKAIGTPLYMSPEQIQGDGKIGPRTDLYALAHIAYALLAGEPYWTEEAQTVESIYPLLVRVMKGLAEPATVRARRRRGAQIPPGFDAWFARAVSLEPQYRFTTASEQVEALADACGVPRARASSQPPAPTLPMNRVAPTVEEPSGQLQDPTKLSPRASSAGAPALTATPGARTTAALSSESAPPAAPATPKKSPGLPLALGAFLAVALAAIFGARAAFFGAAASAPNGATASTTPLPTATVAAPPPTLTATAATTALATATASAPTAAPSASVAPTAKPVAGPAKPAAPRRPGDCDSRPWTIDSAGHKQARPECQ